MNFQSIAILYRGSLKPADSFFNIYLARPLAAVIVALCVNTRITPNQITFASLIFMYLSMGILAFVPSDLGLFLGVLGLEFSYILDCADGQLARVTKQSSLVGGLLDFMMDELKAYLVVFAIGIRWHIEWLSAPKTCAGAWIFEQCDIHWLSPLILALFALISIASAISLTKFIRSPEYAQATHQKTIQNGESAGQEIKGIKGLIQAIARLITQYPVTFPIFAYFHALWLFLLLYGLLHTAYTVQSVIGVMRSLGKSHSEIPASLLDSNKKEISP
jgi:phosphatidylglycerophosphate synthase